MRTAAGKQKATPTCMSTKQPPRSSHPCQRSRGTSRNGIGRVASAVPSRGNVYRLFGNRCQPLAGCIRDQSCWPEVAIYRATSPSKTQDARSVRAKPVPSSRASTVSLRRLEHDPVLGRPISFSKTTVSRVLTLKVEPRREFVVSFRRAPGVADEVVLKIWRPNVTSPRAAGSRRDRPCGTSPAATSFYVLRPHYGLTGMHRRS
jgi:hypothetical protein